MQDGAVAGKHYILLFTFFLPVMKEYEQIFGVQDIVLRWRQVVRMDD